MCVIKTALKIFVFMVLQNTKGGFYNGYCTNAQEDYHPNN